MEAIGAFGAGRPRLQEPPDAEVFDGLSRRMDSGHSVVLRGLLDTGDPPCCPGQPDLLSALSVRFDALRQDVVDKLGVLRGEIPDRWGEPVLAQRLMEAGWYRGDPWATSGRGSRKDLRSIYLLCFRELLAECERILVHCQSRCDHLDDLAARQWLERPAENGARATACLAEGLRPGEAERSKSWRTSLSRLGENAFCTGLSGIWEKTVAPHRAALHQLAARPWATSREDGFQGFGRRLVDLAQAIAESMIWLSRSRWELHLRPAAPIREGEDA